VPALACLDDGVWSRVLPRALVRRAERAAQEAKPSAAMERTSWAVAALIALLSIQPVVNLASPHQIMNTSFDRFDLVNTYGAFGTVGRERGNVVFEGTNDDPHDAHAEWKPYPYRALPVELDRRPVVVAPFQPRLDWQMWFAAMGSVSNYPWTIHLVWKLLHNDPGALSLFAGNPFPDHPPRAIRATLYRYAFAPPGDQGRYWVRDELGPWLPPLSADDPDLLAALRSMGWLEGAPDSRPGTEGAP
jgi:lipase maturation factor